MSEKSFFGGEKGNMKTRFFEGIECNGKYMFNLAMKPQVHVIQWVTTEIWSYTKTPLTGKISQKGRQPKTGASETSGSRQYIGIIRNHSTHSAGIHLYQL